MKTSTRAFRLAVGLAATLGFASNAAQAQDAWPSKRISLVIGFAVGGFADTVGRIIGNKLGERLNQTIIIQTMDGAGGNTAARYVSLQQPADGYTFLITTTSLAINETLYKNKQFSASSLVPIAIPVSAPESLVTNPKSGIKSFPDLFAAAKEGRAFLGTPGIGSGSHIAAEYFFKKIAKIDVKHIPFQGGNPAMQGLLAGDINVFASTATASTIPPVNSGELLGLAVASLERDPALPNVPTFAELGYKDFLASSWTGVFARAGTPDAIVERMNHEINEAMKDEDVKKRMQSLGLLITMRSQKDTAAFFKDEISRWATMVEATGLSM
jgi:tripartite-type tricarboxylate transporter receptor subunit TctC